MQLWRWLIGARPMFVSRKWLTDLDQQSSRVPYDGVRIQFPVKKLINEASPRMNAARLRKRA